MSGGDVSGVLHPAPVVRLECASSPITLRNDGKLPPSRSPRRDPTGQAHQAVARKTDRGSLSIARGNIRAGPVGGPAPLLPIFRSVPTSTWIGLANLARARPDALRIRFTSGSPTVNPRAGTRSSRAPSPASVMLSTGSANSFVPPRAVRQRIDRKAPKALSALCGEGQERRQRLRVVAMISVTRRGVLSRYRCVGQNVGLLDDAFPAGSDGWWRRRACRVGGESSDVCVTFCCPRSESCATS